MADQIDYNTKVTDEERVIQKEYLRLLSDGDKSRYELLLEHRCLDWERWGRGGIFLLTPSGYPEIPPV